MTDFEDALTAQVVVSPLASEKACGYDIEIGPGLLDDLPRILSARLPASRYALIADSNTAVLYGERLLERLLQVSLPADLYVFPAGEVNKSRESWADLSDRLLSARFGRDSAILALGGGVTGDLAGFVAATYMRGLPLVQLPTTLLAMIDSSVGGKTGVDTPAGKNLIGSFHQPHFVHADTNTLATLPLREIASGLAEAVKHGAIADAAYFGWIAETARRLLDLDPRAMIHLVRRSVEIKAGVVALDERENGLRKILNFGHTVGHAVEAHSGFTLLHGEAISIGMVIEATIGEMLEVTERGTAERLRQIFARLGLPTDLPADCSPSSILELTRLDKKSRGGRVEYSLIERIGTASRGSGSFGTPVDDSVVVAALNGNG